MSNEAKEIRCVGCGRLLAKVRDGQLIIQRGGVDAKVEGAFRAVLVCSQPRCRRPRSVDVLSDPARRMAFRT